MRRHIFVDFMGSSKIIDSDIYGDAEMTSENSVLTVCSNK